MHYRTSIAVVLIALAKLACARDGGGGLFTGNQGTGATTSGKADSPNSSASCKDKCAGPSDDESCWCDPGCEVVGDCCADFASECASKEPATGGTGAGGTGAGGAGAGGAASGGTGGKAGSGGTASVGGGAGSGGGGFGGAASNPNSCAGHCGGPSASGACYCDQECQASGDCCLDVALCGGGAGGAPGNGCTPALCNSDQPASQGGMECYCDALCVEYGDCCANKPQVCGG